MENKKAMGSSRDQVLALLFFSCVTWGRSLSLSDPHLSKGFMNDKAVLKCQVSPRQRVRDIPSTFVMSSLFPLFI
jgi:hypothetical protein